MTADRKTIARNAAVRSLLLHHAQAVIVQSAQLVLCNTRHQIVQRLARWLLLAHDRLEADEVAITHAAISQTLGVQRASITEAVRELDQAGAVHATRRCMAVLSRTKLEEKTCGCYGVIKSEYDRMLRVCQALQ